MRCDSCQFKKGYTLGADECGAGSEFTFCGKGHWEGDDTEPQDEQQNIEMKLNPEIDFWKDCRAYQKVSTNVS